MTDLHRRKVRYCVALLLIVSLLSSTATIADEPFRPEAGKFPPADKAKSYTGELTFVDHANRRASLRIKGRGPFYAQAATPFAMLPYGMVRYLGAPADLRDIPLGTILHGRFYLPPEPRLSSVPTFRSSSRQVHFVENHAVLLEDEPSYCLRKGLVWKLQEVERKNDKWLVVAHRGPKDGEAGQATVIATLVGGMDESLYADFKKGIRGQMSPVARNLKHGIGDIGHYHTAIEGSIVDVTKLDGEAPPGSSGIQIQMKVGMVLEGFRAGGVVRIRPMSWPDAPVPREEYIKGIEDRFPSPDIFSKQ